MIKSLKNEYKKRISALTAVALAGVGGKKTSHSLGGMIGSSVLRRESGLREVKESSQKELNEYIEMDRPWKLLWS